MALLVRARVAGAEPDIPRGVAIALRCGVCIEGGGALASGGGSGNYAGLESHFPHWEKIGDCIAQFIDVTLNYRQSGHPWRIALQEAHDGRPDAERCHALGHPPPGEALSGTSSSSRPATPCR